MLLSDLLTHVSKEYPIEKEKDIKNNELAGIIRKKAKDVIPPYIFKDDNYKISGSAGQGQWAHIPWIGIFDKDITKSATSGAYIVYLFSLDYKKVYLALASGWTQFKDKDINPDIPPKDAIKKVSEFWKLKLNLSEKQGFTTDEIDLNPDKLDVNTELIPGYEIGTFYSKSYKIENLDNDQLLSDLVTMKEYYSALKRELTNDNYSDTIKYFLTNGDNLLEDVKIERKYQKTNIDDLYTKMIKQPLTYTGVDEDDNENKQKTNNFSPKNKIDHIKKNKENTRLGAIGEELILRLEKERINKSPHEQLRSKEFDVKQVSDTDDSLGYDILSFDINKYGEVIEKYIEVKTTQYGKKTSFYLSNNQLSKISVELDNYYIYRVYGLEKKLPSYYIIDQDSFKLMKSVPTNYRIDLNNSFK